MPPGGESGGTLDLGPCGRQLKGNHSPAIAIVTARGGSKRIPGKNIRLFHGVPLITWTIRNLFASEIFSNVIVSTDSDEIAEIAQTEGAEVPFRRPPQLSDDFATTAQVAEHAISFLLDRGASLQTDFCVAYPAAVAITASDLITSKRLLNDNGFDLVFAGCEFPSHPSRGWSRGADGVATALNSLVQNARTQDLDPWYYDAGQFYWSRHDTWARIGRRQEVTRGIHIMPRWRATDIDTEEDWFYAESLFPITQRLNSRQD